MHLTANAKKAASAINFATVNLHGKVPENHHLEPAYTQYVQSKYGCVDHEISGLSLKFVLCLNSHVFGEPVDITDAKVSFPSHLSPDGSVVCGFPHQSGVLDKP